MCRRMHRNAFLFFDPITAKGTAMEALPSSCRVPFCEGDSHVRSPLRALRLARQTRPRPKLAVALRHAHECTLITN